MLPASALLEEVKRDLGINAINSEGENEDALTKLEKANRADTAEMNWLRALAKEGTLGYMIGLDQLLRIEGKIYIPEEPPSLAASLLAHIHEQPLVRHPGCQRMIQLIRP